MSWISAILQFYSQVADLFGNVIVKRINISLFDLLARFHYILNLPRILPLFKHIFHISQSLTIFFFIYSCFFCLVYIRTSFNNSNTEAVRQTKNYDGILCFLSRI